MKGWGRSINSGFSFKDYLEYENCKCFDLDFLVSSRVKALDDAREQKLTHPVIKKLESSFQNLVSLNVFDLPFRFDVKDGICRLSLDSGSGDESESCKNLVNELDPKIKEGIFDFLQQLCPWKKGPFEIMGTFIDSEWRSDLKWDRIKEQVGKIEGRRIADLGCNNGYFMYRMSQYNPRLIIGIETFLKYKYLFDFISPFIKQNLYFETFSAECIRGYHNFFNTVLCMGLIYHMRDPVGLLHSIHNSLKKGGRLILESAGIEAEGSMALCPEGRYNGCSGVWYVPSKDCLYSWLRRADFKNIDCFLSLPLTDQEQRSTSWANIKSYLDFLSSDRTRTIEGYDLPIRYYFVASK